MTLVNEILEFLLEVAKMVPLPLETPYEHIRRIRKIQRGAYRHSLWQMNKRGVIKVSKKQNQEFIKITEKGQLQILLLKARINPQREWDGKWRVIIFDIPESAKQKRTIFRALLKNDGFYKLQASVYISPYSLNREALLYLRETGLNKYIRIFRADEMDYDKDLLKKFSLQS